MFGDIDGCSWAWKSSKLISSHNWSLDLIWGLVLFTWAWLVGILLIILCFAYVIHRVWVWWSGYFVCIYVLKCLVAKMQEKFFLLIFLIYIFKSFTYCARFGFGWFVWVWPTETEYFGLWNFQPKPTKMAGNPSVSVYLDFSRFWSVFSFPKRGLFDFSRPKC